MGEEIMKFKKIMFVSILLLAILAIGAVSASDENVTDELTVGEDLNIESSAVDSNEFVGAQDNQAISENASDMGTFGELSDLINGASGTTLNLTKDYIYVDGSGDGIEINKAITIDGKGHTIDANGKSRIFQLAYSVSKNVVLKNIIFKNGYHEDSGGAVDISFTNIKEFYNCSFINCSAGIGGAVRSYSPSQMVDCSFINCSSTRNGGVVYDMDANIINSTFINCADPIKEAKAINCTFMNSEPGSYRDLINCKVYPYVLKKFDANHTFNHIQDLINDADDGDVIVLCGNYGGVETEIEVNKSLIILGVDALLDGQGTRIFHVNADNVSFKNITFLHGLSRDSGGSIISASNGIEIDNCTFIESKSTDEWGGAVFLSGVNCTIANTRFIDCYAYQGGAANLLSNSIINCTFINCSADYAGGAIVNGHASYCSFINCSAVYGGAMQYGTANHCDFINCYAWYGGATSETHAFNDCTFTNCRAGEDGGAIGTESKDKYSDVNNCTFINCHSGNEGGAIDCGYVTNSLFDNCTSPNGGAQIEGTCENCTFINCFGGIHAGIYEIYVRNNMFTVRIDKPVTGEVKLFTEGDEYKFNLTDNGYCLDVDGLPSGSHLFNITFSGDDVYAPFSRIMTYLDFAFKTHDVYVGGDEIIEISVDRNISLEASYCFDGDWWDVDFSEGKANITLHDLSQGDKEVKFDFDGDERYIRVYKTILFTVSPIEGSFTALQNKINNAEKDSTLLLDRDYSYCWGDRKIMIDKELTIDGNGHAIDADSKSGIFELRSGVTFKNITFMNADGRAIYNGGLLASTLISCTFINCSSSSSGGAIYNYDSHCDMRDCTFINCSSRYSGGAVYSNNYFCVNNIVGCTFINCSSGSGGGAVYLSGDGSEIINSTFANNVADYGGAVYSYADGCRIFNSIFANNAADMGGAIYVSGLNNSLINLRFTDNAANEGRDWYNSTDIYVSNITYENANDNSSNINKTVTPEILIPPLDEPSVDGSVTITLPSDATGTVTLNINGQNYTFDVKNGVTNVKLPELGDGNYDYTITYSGDSKYSSFSTNGNMKVNNTKPEDTKPTPEIVVPPLDKPSNEGSVKVTLPSDATGKVTLSIGGKEYTYLVENGVANVIIPNLGEGDYPYTITYSGDSKYSSFTTNGSLNKSAPKVDPKITAKNTAVQYSAKGKYSVTVYGADGKVASGVLVIFKISGKQVGKAKTNTKGVASYVVTKNPGKYKIQATALGKSVTKTVTVKHIVTLKTVTLKKSAKKLTLQATLAKVNGKYLKKKTVTFKINGKKVATAKTNSKGVAKITIKNPNVVKKLKVGKKITYQATYLKDTVKQNVKVKK